MTRPDEPDHLPGEAQPGTGFARGFIWGLAVWAILLLLFVGLRAVADRVTVTGMGGGPMQWGYNQAERYWRDGEPIRLEGRYTSAGTFLLWSVERLPGSCIAPDAIFDFHEPTMPGSGLVGCMPFPIGHPDRDDAIADITRPYNDCLTEWFMERVVGDEAECLPYTTLRGRALAACGYPVCEGED